METNDIPFNPAVFGWARSRIRMSIEDAARRLRLPTERIAEWESGKSRPTVPQARRLAKIYDRPFLEFLSPTLPEVKPPSIAPDFRFHRIPPSENERSTLEGIHAWAEEQRLNAISLYEELGDEPPRFPQALRANVERDPNGVAKIVREFLGPPVAAQLALPANDRYKFPSMLRRAFEAIGVLVLKQSGLGETRTRGICLFEDILPIIVFGNESPGGQAFTLAHEFAHLVLGVSALSGTQRFTYTRGAAEKRLEGWCNVFAAAFLMPEAEVRSNPLSPKSYVESIPDGQLSRLAQQFCVSRHAMLVRLVFLKLVSARFYWRIKRSALIQEEADYESFGRSTYYASRYRHALGDSYTNLVIEAVETGKIGFQAAAELMGTKRVRHFLDIRDHFAD